MSINVQPESHKALCVQICVWNWTYVLEAGNVHCQITPVLQNYWV